jgi:tRNA(Arg) A34 adenosine deaminase TadA
MRPSEVLVQLPDWVTANVRWDETYPTAVARMGLAIDLARTNVRERTGGPFGAVVFDRRTDRPIAVGVNLVERARNAFLHAETVALMLAQASVGRHSLHGADLPPVCLSTSCEPCAMCLGAILWSGVRDVECGASRADAVRIGFEEGPVFAASYDYLTTRGVSFQHGIRRAEAAAVLQAYVDGGGSIYNG